MTRRGVLLLLVVAVGGRAGRRRRRRRAVAGRRRASNAQPAAARGSRPRRLEAARPPSGPSGTAPTAATRRCRWRDLIEQGQPGPRGVPRRRVRRGHGGGVRPQLPPRLRPVRQDHRPDAGQPRLAEPRRGLRPVLGQGEPAACPPNRHYYRFKAGGWEFISLNSESGLAAGLSADALAEGAGAGQAGQLPHRVLAPAVPERRPARRPGGHRACCGARCAAAPRSCSTATTTTCSTSSPRDGIVELISGAGGHEHYSSNENDPRLVWDEDDQSGALRLDLRPRPRALPLRLTDRGTIHKGSVRCHRWPSVRTLSGSPADSAR